MKREVRSGSAPQPIGPYSQAVESGDSVFCSGQIGLDPSTGNLEQGLVQQTRRALSNLREVLRASGLDLENVTKTSVYMTDLGQFAQMNEEYSRHFKAPFPARTTVQVAALPKGALVEIDAIAKKS
jgi:2-iminobutanoate/2-iminopropanoate deaminase